MRPRFLGQDLGTSGGAGVGVGLAASVEPGVAVELGVEVGLEVEVGSGVAVGAAMGVGEADDGLAEDGCDGTGVWADGGEEGIGADWPGACMTGLAEHTTLAGNNKAKKIRAARMTNLHRPYSS